MFDTRRPQAQIKISYHTPLTEKPLPSPVDDAPLFTLSDSTQESSPPAPSPPSFSKPRSSKGSPMVRLHSHKPSLSSTMSWLTRSTSSASQQSTVPYAVAAKPVRISEPRLFDARSSPLVDARASPLGSGAVVVRTPQEALAGSDVLVSPSPPLDEQLVNEIAEVDESAIPEVESAGFSGHRPEPESEPEESASEYGDDEMEEHAEEEPTVRTPRHSGDTSSEGYHVPPAYSPPRPVLPLSKSTPCLAAKLAPPSRPCPPVPVLDATVAPLKVKSASPTPSVFTQPPPTPSFPTYITTPSPQPAFDCIQLSDVSFESIHGPLDPSRVIVTVETSSSSHRTTLATLTSRPSYLGTHLLTLLTPSAEERDEQLDGNPDDEDDMSLRVRDDEDDYSDRESYMPSIFKHHLAASGLLLPSPVAPTRNAAPVTRMHIFLDRPTEPYEHIFSYLRSTSSLDQPSTLPSALRLLPHTVAATHMLVAVRDEAHYLGLVCLSGLCTSELRARYAPPPPPRPTHSRGPSGASLHTLRDSVGSAGSGSSGTRGAFGHRRLASRERANQGDGVVVPPEGWTPGEIANGSKSLRMRQAAVWV